LLLYGVDSRTSESVQLVRCHGVPEYFTGLSLRCAGGHVVRCRDSCYRRRRGERGSRGLWAAGARQDTAGDGRSNFFLTRQCGRTRTIGPDGSGARPKTFYGETILEFLRKHLLRLAVVPAPGVPGQAVRALPSGGPGGAPEGPPDDGGRPGSQVRNALLRLCLLG